MVGISIIFSKHAAHLLHQSSGHCRHISKRDEGLPGSLTKDLSFKLWGDASRELG
jgi:hypothetical protein